MASRKTGTIRPYFPGDDDAGIARVLHQVCSFDGSVEAWDEDTLQRRLAAFGDDDGIHWRVATSSNGTIIGVLLVDDVGSIRSEVVLAVNPAFRRQGLGSALIAKLPEERRLLTSSRDSVGGSAALLSGAGFRERFRRLMMRREATGIRPLPLEDARIVDDVEKSPRRALLALTAAMGDDVDDDLDVLKAQLSHERAGMLYLVTEGPDGKPVDAGVCMLRPSPFAKKGERTAAGEPIVGIISHVGLMRSIRGKGLSRALVRAGMRKAEAVGFRFVEVHADKRRASAVELYEREGFEAVDEQVYWMRREP